MNFVLFLLLKKCATNILAVLVLVVYGKGTKSRRKAAVMQVGLGWRYLRLENSRFDLLRHEIFFHEKPAYTLFRFFKFTNSPF